MNNSTSILPTSTLYVPATIPAVEVLYFLVLFTCGILGTGGNLMALYYFSGKKKDIPTIIYIFISLIDAVVCMLSIVDGVPFLSDIRDGVLLEEPVFCNLFGVLWYVSSIMTVFLVAVLSITRAVHLLFPFKRLNKTTVIVTICVYIALLVLQSSIPLWIGQSYIYEVDFCTCMFIAGQELGVWKIIYENIYNFEYYFPIIPIILSCFITISSLKNSDCNEEINRSNRTATRTIVGLTMMYVIFNVPPSVMFIFTMVVNNFYPEYALQLYSWDREYWYFFVFQLKLTVSMNSALNPALYFWRMNSFRRHVGKLMRGAHEQLKSLSAVRTSVISPESNDTRGVISPESNDTRGA